MLADEPSAKAAPPAVDAGEARLSVRERRVDPPVAVPALPPVTRAVDTAVLAAVHATTRALFGATDPDAVVQLLVDLVRTLGAEAVPAGAAPPHALPLDLGLGQVPPLLAVASPVSVARLHLETMLPPVVEDARTTIQRLREQRRLEQEAGTDVLTGALTRRVLFRRICALREGDAVALLDLDRFKVLNDTRGHAAGDDALHAFGALLLAGVRDGDVVGRYGGEELLVGFRGTGAAQAARRVEELRAAWRAQDPPVTFSAGVAAVGPAGPAAAVAAADAVMYRAKLAGRDRTEIAG